MLSEVSLSSELSLSCARPSWNAQAKRTAHKTRKVLCFLQNAQVLCLLQNLLACAAHVKKSSGTKVGRGATVERVCGGMGQGRQEVVVTG